MCNECDCSSFILLFFLIFLSLKICAFYGIRLALSADKDMWRVLHAINENLTLALICHATL